MRNLQTLTRQACTGGAIVALLAICVGSAVAGTAMPLTAQAPTPPQGEQAGAQQGEQAAGPQAGQQPGATTQPMLTPEEQEALALVEQIIRDQEGIMLGTGFDYQPGSRRDPFRSLLRIVNPGDGTGGTRPPGIGGFLISEIELKAIAAAQGRWHAMVTGPDQRAYFLEVGTEVYDGHVIDIRPGQVIFQQEVPDLMGARRTREVAKELRTDSGGGRTP